MQWALKRQLADFGFTNQQMMVIIGVVEVWIGLKKLILILSAIFSIGSNMTVTAGATSQIDASTSADVVEFGRIDDDTVIAFYNDTNTQLSARVLDINRATISITTVNSQQDLQNQGYHFSNIQVVQLSTNKYLVWGAGTTPVGATIAVVNNSGGTLSYESAGELTPTDAGGMQSQDNNQMVQLTSTTALIAYGDFSNSEMRARVVSIDGSDNVSEGAAAQISDDHLDLFRLIAFSPTKVLMVFNDDDDGDALKGRILTISGTTVTPETIKTIDTVENWGLISLAKADSTRAVVVAETFNTEYGYILTLSGTTFNVGAQQALNLGDTSTASDFRAVMPNADTLIVGYEGGSDDWELYEIDVDLGSDTLTVTNNDTIAASLAAGDRPRIFAFHSSTIIAGTFASVDGTIASTATATVATPGELTSAPMFKPCSIDADGDFIYIGGINSLGFPTLLKFSTALNADATVVFNPGAGDDIGVECGNFNADVVWVAGAFDSTNVVEKTEDGGTSFVVKDDGTFGDVSAFRVGPDSDDRILIVDDNQDIHETIDDGDNWTTHQTAVGIATKSVARLDKNVQEIVLGNVASASINIQYSINSGTNLQDYSSGFPEIDVNGVIVS